MLELDFSPPWFEIGLKDELLLPMSSVDSLISAFLLKNSSILKWTKTFHCLVEADLCI